MGERFQFQNPIGYLGYAISLSMESLNLGFTFFDHRTYAFKVR